MALLDRATLDKLLSAEGTTTHDTSDQVVVRHKREETRPRQHVYLAQTVPPRDPTVRAIEGRRSGRE